MLIGTGSGATCWMGSGAWTGTSRYITFGSGGYIMRTTANVISCRRAMTTIVATAV